MAKTLHKPGEDNQRPGRYIEVGPRGGQVKDPRVISIDKGDRLPPTSEEGHRWVKH
ncbi:YjzC family protein [Olegusella massiliensis]|uniref:YjzC family protein n=1 Tax=Olegusella massiliensis TaxID=1776381 RepID=UPI00083958C3|nr:YjzC family protein [Olegusella massiliensis]